MSEGAREGATSEGAREGRGGIIMEVLCKWAYGPDVEIARKINASEGKKRGDFHYVGWKLASWNVLLPGKTA